MRRITRTALAVLMVAAAALVAGASPATADDTFCNNGAVDPGGKEVSILGKPGDPLTIGVQIAPGTTYTRFVLCYGTAAASAPGAVAAGSLEVDNWSDGTTGAHGYLLCDGDDTAPVSPDCRYDYGANAQPSITPTAQPGGETVTASIPFRLCVGSCITDSTALGMTGVIVGRIVSGTAPSGGTGASYTVSDVQVFINGQQLVGGTPIPIGGGYVVYKNPFDSSISLSPSGGSTCVLGTTCPEPVGKLGLNGVDSTVILVLPVAGSVPVTVPVPSLCVLSFDGPC